MWFSLFGTPRALSRRSQAANPVLSAGVLCRWDGLDVRAERTAPSFDVGAQNSRTQVLSAKTPILFLEGDHREMVCEGVRCTGRLVR